MVLIFSLLGASHSDVYNGPIDIHLPDKEELWIEWVAEQEQHERDEGTRVEIIHEDGTKEEILVG